MIDFTKATQMTDARGNVVPVEFVETVSGGWMMFRALAVHYTTSENKWNAGETWAFDPKGESSTGIGLKLIPPASEQKPAEWALREFCERSNLIYSELWNDDRGVALRSAVRAGARLIEQHETQPVDKLQEALEIAFPLMSPDRLATALAELRKHGVTVSGDA